MDIKQNQEHVAAANFDILHSMQQIIAGVTYDIVRDDNGLLIDKASSAEELRSNQTLVNQITKTVLRGVVLNG